LELDAERRREYIMLGGHGFTLRRRGIWAIGGALLVGAAALILALAVDRSPSQVAVRGATPVAPIDAKNAALVGVDEAAFRSALNAKIATLGKADGSPVLIVRTTMDKVQKSIGQGDKPSITRPVIVVQITGQFTDSGAHPPPGASLPNGSELELFYDPSTLTPVGLALGNSGMDLAALGSVEQFEL
jgi:hypothetical protein